VKFGFSVATGVNVPISQRLEFDAGAGYTQVIRLQDQGFFGLKAGFKLPLP